MASPGFANRWGRFKTLKDAFQYIHIWIKTLAVWCHVSSPMVTLRNGERAGDKKTTTTLFGSGTRKTEHGVPVMNVARSCNMCWWKVQEKSNIYRLLIVLHNPYHFAITLITDWIKMTMIILFNSFFLSFFRTWPCTGMDMQNSFVTIGWLLQISQFSWLLETKNIQKIVIYSLSGA